MPIRWVSKLLIRMNRIVILTKMQGKTRMSSSYYHQKRVMFHNCHLQNFESFEFLGGVKDYEKRVDISYFCSQYAKGIFPFQNKSHLWILHQALIPKLRRVHCPHSLTFHGSNDFQPDDPETRRSPLRCCDLEIWPLAFQVLRHFCADECRMIFHDRRTSNGVCSNVLLMRE